MANRSFRPIRGSLSREVVKLYGNVTVGSSGAVSSSSAKGFSVALTASEAGRYTITLEDSYNAFLGCNVTVVQADDAAITASYAGVRNVDVSSSGKTLDIQFVDEAFADADLASGDLFYIEIMVQNGADY